MEVEVACRFATTSRLMHRSMRSDMTLAAPAHLELATFPCSNHCRHSWCTVDVSRCVSAEIYRMDQPALLSPITKPLVKLSVCWNSLR
ncbi:hypothetical protein X975_02179, partial [Stegodyphus mimosarum]